MVFWNRAADQSFSKLPKETWQGGRWSSNRTSQSDLRRPITQGEHDSSRPGSKRSYNDRPSTAATPEWSAPSSYQPTRASSISSRRSSKGTSIISTDNGESFSKSFLKHGKRLRRQGSKIFGGSAPPSGEPSRSSSALGSIVSASASGRSTPHTGGARPLGPNPVISTPSNFQHLTHTQAKQFGNISRTSQNDLIAEFAAVRAGQSSRTDLRGIKTEALHSRGSSIDTSYTLHSSAVPSLVESSSSRDSLVSSGLSSPASRQSIRSIRSKDSFSLPFYNGRPPRLREPPMAPPRTSSRRAPTRGRRQMATADYPSTDNVAPGTVENRDSGFYEPSRHSDEKYMPTEHNWDDVPDYTNQTHAVSTPDDYNAENPNWYPQTFESSLPSVNEEETASMYSQPDPGIVNTYDRNQTVYEMAGRSSPMSLDSGHSTHTITAATYQRGAEDLEPIDEDAPYESSDSQTKKSRFSMNRTSAVNGLFSSWQWDDDTSDSDEEAQPDPPIVAGLAARNRSSQTYTDQHLVCQDPWAYRTTDPIYEEDEESMADPEFFRSASTSQTATPKAPSTPKRTSLDTSSQRSSRSYRRISGTGSVVGKSSSSNKSVDLEDLELRQRHRLSQDVQADLDELQKSLAKLEQESAYQIPPDSRVHIQSKPSRIPVSSVRLRGNSVNTTPTTPPPKKRKIVAFVDDPAIREIHTTSYPGPSRIPVPSDEVSDSPSPPRMPVETPTSGEYTLSLFPSPPAVRSSVS